MFRKTTMICWRWSASRRRHGPTRRRAMPASHLSAIGKQIYAAVVAANPTLQNLRDTVRSQARGMVMGGQISRDDAEANAALRRVRARAPQQQ